MRGSVRRHSLKTFLISMAPGFPTSSWRFCASHWLAGPSPPGCAFTTEYLYSTLELGSMKTTPVKIGKLSGVVMSETPCKLWGAPHKRHFHGGAMNRTNVRH